MNRLLLVLALVLAVPSAGAQSDLNSLQQMQAQLDSGRVWVWPNGRGERSFVLVDSDLVRRLFAEETSAGRMSSGAAQAIVAAAKDAAAAARAVVATEILLTRIGALDGESTSSADGGFGAGAGAGGASSASLTGLWTDDSGGGATYRIRQEGGSVWWIVDGTPQGSYVNIAVGTIANGVVQLRWVDLPGSPTMGGGDLTLRVDGPNRMTKTATTAAYGANSWTRVGGGR